MFNHLSELRLTNWPKTVSIDMPTCRHNNWNTNPKLNSSVQQTKHYINHPTCKKLLLLPLMLLKNIIFNAAFNAVPQCLQCCFTVPLNVAINAVWLLLHADFRDVPKAFYDCMCLSWTSSAFRSLYVLFICCLIWLSSYDWFCISIDLIMMFCCLFLVSFHL